LRLEEQASPKEYQTSVFLHLPSSLYPAVAILGVKWMMLKRNSGSKQILEGIDYLPFVAAEEAL
jgi:hypothetical protein